MAVACAAPSDGKISGVRLSELRPCETQQHSDNTASDSTALAQLRTRPPLRNCSIPMAVSGSVGSAVIVALGVNVETVLPAFRAIGLAVLKSFDRPARLGFE